MCGEGEISASKGDREETERGNEDISWRRQRGEMKTSSGGDRKETRDEENRPLSPDDIGQQYSAWNRSIKSMVLIRS